MTLRYVFDQPKIVADCVAQMIPHMHGRKFGNCSAIGVIDEEGKLIAGIVYTHWQPEDGTIQIHAASIHPRWLTRETMRVMYTYPFHQLGVQMIFQLTPADDERLLRQLAAGNYEFIRLPRMFGRDKDGVLCLLTYEDWCENRFCKKWKHHIRPEQLEEAA